MNSRPFALRPGQRLRGARAFAELRETGQRRICGSLIVNWRPLDTGRASRLGVVTGRRIGNAVARSRARRLMREAFRLNQNCLRVPVALVLVARPSLVGRSLAEVCRDFRQCLTRAGLWIEDPTPVLPCAPSS